MARRPLGFRPSTAALLLVLLFGSGCGGNSFLAQRFDNFTAYYNKFYNASHAFERGVKALERQDQPVDRSRFLALFTSPGQAVSSAEFEDAILKSADMLRAHPTSKWVDDALLVIGKSYFYQQNYVGAEQKFREIVSIGSPLQDEARFWLARSLIASGAYDEATEHLTATLVRDNLSPRWEPMLRLALGELYVKRESWEDAAEQLEQGLEQVRDNDLGARAQFLLGQVYEQTGRYEAAAAAYDRVGRYNPVYELSYAAQLSAIRVEGIYGDAEAALRALRRMERDDKHYGHRYEMSYIRARIYQAHARADEAYALYSEILYDAEASTATLRGPVHYALGELYRDLDQDYLMAAAHFDTARTAFQSARGSATAAAPGSSSRGQALYAPGAITDAAEQAEMFGSFAEVREQIARADSLLHLGGLDDEAFADRIYELRVQLAEQMAAQQRELERRQTVQRFQEAAGTNQQGQRGGQAAAQVNSSAGFLFHKDPVLVQEARMNFQAVWGDRPLVPNWRRVDAVMAIVAEGGDEGGEAVGGLGGAGRGGEELPIIDYSEVPRDEAARAELRAERAAARYELGNVLFLAMGKPDSAAAWYRMVIEEDADQPVAQRAYYALAEVQRALDDTAAARRLYEHVLEAYPESDFADRVREQLGMAVRQQAPSDTLALAEAAYGDAYRAWQRGAYNDALDRMVRLAARYPATSVAPRALLAAGTIYMEWAARDSLDLFGPLPVTVPDSLWKAAGFILPTEESAEEPTAELAEALVEETGIAGGGVRPPAGSDVTSDTTAAGADSTALAALPVAADSAAALVSSVDSAAVAASDTLALSDTLAPPAEEGAVMIAAAGGDRLFLEGLYANITRRYPDTPYASRADRVMTVLTERRAAPAADSAGTPADSLADMPAPDGALAGTVAPDGVPADSVPSDSTSSDRTQEGGLAAVEDSLAAAQTTAASLAERRALAAEERGERPAAGDAEAASAASGGASEISSAAEAMRRRQELLQQQARGAGAGAEARQPDMVMGSEPVDPAKGGWTIVIGSGTERGQVEQMVQGLRYMGFRTGLHVSRVGEANWYRALVGQFGTQAEARQALRAYAGRLPEAAEVYQLKDPQ